MYQEKYVDLLSDAGFKAVLGDQANKPVLIDLINIIMEGERTVVDLTYENVELAPQVKDGKSVRLDLFCKDEDGTAFIVEMQKMRHDGNFFRRSVYYGSMALTLQLKKGMTAYDYQPVYVIGIMEGQLRESTFVSQGTGAGSDKVITRYDFRERQTLRRPNPTISCIFVELGRFQKRYDECSTLAQKCMYVLKNAPTINEEPGEFPEDVMERLLAASEVARFDEGKRLNYNNDKMSEYDRINEDKLSRAEGRAEGMAEGMAEGKAEGKIEVARNMIAEGLDDALIAKVTGLDISEITSLHS